MDAAPGAECLDESNFGRRCEPLSGLQVFDTVRHIRSKHLSERRTRSKIAAADRATASGFETLMACLPGATVTSAPARPAIARWAAGGITLSSKLYLRPYSVKT